MVLVLDDFHVLSEESVLPSLLLSGADSLPPGATIMVISRNQPPPEFQRLKANNLMMSVGWNEIRFTREEVSAIVKGLHCERCGHARCPDADFFYEKSDGWAAGLRLMMEVRGHQLFVTDSANGRVLIWNSWPTTDDQPANTVLGQTDFITVDTTSGTQRSILANPTGLYLSGGKLIVGDSTDNRYLVFNGSYSTTPLLGALLYTAYGCNNCHLPIGESRHLGATAADIQNGIDTYTSMQDATVSITTDQINDIAAALDQP